MTITRKLPAGNARTEVHWKEKRPPAVRDGLLFMGVSILYGKHDRCVGTVVNRGHTNYLIPG